MNTKKWIKRDPRRDNVERKEAKVHHCRQDPEEGTGEGTDNQKEQNGDQDSAGLQARLGKEEEERDDRDQVEGVLEVHTVQEDLVVKFCGCHFVQEEDECSGCFTSEIVPVVFPPVPSSPNRKETHRDDDFDDDDGRSLPAVPSSRFNSTLCTPSFRYPGNLSLS